MCYNRTMSNVEDIKDRLTIEEVVSQYVELKSSGINLKGRCPFHAEKTPSFIVSPLRQTYHCFGCGVGGDIFTFIQEIEGLDFKGALKMLADKAGVTLTYTKSDTNKDEKDTLYDILEQITVFYQSKLTDKHRTYLHERGIQDDVIDSFRIGFAPESWTEALEYLKGKGFSQKDIETSGIVKQGNKGVYDRFRSRIMFPIADSVGRSVAFSGRIFGTENNEAAKYINSPETPLYNKSNILYGYNLARQAIRKNDFAVVVEGQMDLLAVHQAGYTNTVAISGTAFTKQHLALLKRMSGNMILALDADEAGIKSACKSAFEAIKEGFDVKIARLPEGSDPADLLLSGGKDEWKKVIKNSEHIIDFLLSYFREKTKDDRAFKLKVERSILPYVAIINSEIDKQHFIGKIAAQLAVSHEAVEKQVQKAKSDTTQNGTVIENTKDDINKKEKTNADEELVLMWLWQKTLKKPFVDVTLLQKQIEEVLTPIGFKALQERLKDNTKAAFTFETLYSDVEGIQKAIGELLTRIDRKTIAKRIEEIGIALRRAESEGNESAIKENEKKYKELVERKVELEMQLE